jgi:4-amino-4-deoxy-L-arabinose transferase-like glycosyltransferase
MRTVLPARRRSAEGEPPAPARRISVPRPLLLLLFVVFVTTSTWAFATPAWQIPDEPQHFGYAETLVEQGSKPTRGAAVDQATRIAGEGGQISYGGVSGQARDLLAQSNGYPVAFEPYAKPPWSPVAQDRYDRIARRGSLVDGGRRTGATGYPPLYYAVETIPYRLAASGTATDRLYAMRWVSGLWALVGTIGAWLLAGEIFRRRRLPQLAAAATIGLWPMISFLSGAVNPDAMLTALSVLVLWLAVRVALRGTTWRPALVLIVLVGAATATKVSGAALAPAAAFAILFGLPPVRSRVGDSVPRLLGLVGGLVAAALAVVLLGGALNVFPPQLQVIADTRPNLREFGSYLWQFYLPKLGFMDDMVFQFPVVSERPVLNLWVGSSWGAFGWVYVWFPRWAMHVFLAITVLIGVGAARAGRIGWKGRDRERSAPFAAAMVVLAIAALGVFGGVHLQDFINGTEGNLPFAQGRYLFPVAGIGALAVGAAAMAFPRRLRPGAVGSWLAFLVVLQIAALALTATRYYA